MNCSLKKTLAAKIDQGAYCISGKINKREKIVIIFRHHYLIHRKPVIINGKILRIIEFNKVAGNKIKRNICLKNNKNLSYIQTIVEW